LLKKVYLKQKNNNKGLKSLQLPKAKKKYKRVKQMEDTYLEHPTSLAISIIFIPWSRSTLQVILSSGVNGAILIDSCDI